MGLQLVRLAAFVGLVVIGANHATAAEPKASSTSGVMLRLTPTALAEAHGKEFALEQTIEDLVLGTTVKGTAKTEGQCSVRTCTKQAGALNLIVSGVSITTSEGRNGPAIIRSTTTTTFTATAPLTFQVANGFVAGKIDVDAESEMKTDDIQSTQKGIAGTLVKKLAARKVKELHPEAERLAEERAVERITTAIEKELRQRVAKLNASYAALRPVLAATRIDADSKVRLLTHQGCLVVAVGERAKPLSEWKTQNVREADRSVAEVWLQKADIGAEVERKLATLTNDDYLVRVSDAKASKLVLNQEDEWWVVRTTLAPERERVE